MSRRRSLVHPDVLDIPAAAELLAVSKPSVYRLVRAGGVPAWRLGGQWRMWRPAILQAIAGPEAEEQHPMIPADDPELINAGTLADLLDISLPTCHALINDGTIPSRKVGQTTRVWWPSVRQLMIDGSIADSTQTEQH